MTARRVVLLVAAAALLNAEVAAAQQPGRRRFPRRWLVAGVSMMMTGAAALVYAQFRRDPGGNCASSGCVTLISLAGGFGIGFLIGQEFDDLYDKRYRHAPPMSLSGQSLPLSIVPNDIVARAGSLAAAGEGGVEVVTGGARMERGDVRARGLRGVVTALPDPGADRLLVGTTTGLYGFTLSSARPAGGLLAPGEITALDLKGDRALVAAGRTVALARLSGDSVAEVSTPRAFADHVADLRWDTDRGVVWVLTETALLALTVGDSGIADSLGALPLAGTPRRLAVRGSRLAVAAGERGVLVVDAADPRAPRETARWSQARFAYDVALSDSSVYLAGGPEGLYMLRPRPDGTMAALGLARDLGFVAALETDGDSLYLLDRSGGIIRRIRMTAY